MSTSILMKLTKYSLEQVVTFSSRGKLSDVDGEYLYDYCQKKNAKRIWILSQICFHRSYQFFEIGHFPYKIVEFTKISIKKVCTPKKNLK